MKVKTKQEHSTKGAKLKAKPVNSKGPLDVLTDLSVKLDRLHARSAATDLASSGIVKPTRLSLFELD